MSTSIWAAAAGTPTATHRIPVDTSAAGTPTMYTVQQIADLETSVGTSVNALGSIAVNTAIDLALGGFVSATIGANLTFTFTNVPAGGTEFTLVLTNGGAFTITWPGSVTWAGATAPTLTASGTDVLRFTSGNGGTNWYGWHERDEAASGDVVGPASSTDNAVARFDSTTGKLLQNTSNVTIADTGALSITPDANAKALTIASHTHTTSNPAIDVAQTWNAAGVTFTGWKLNITDTTSAAASLLADLQVGGSSRARFSKSGECSVSSSDQSTTYAKINSASGAGYFQVKLNNGNISRAYSDAGGQWLFDNGSNLGGLFVLDTTGTRVNSTAYIGWTDGAAYNGTADVRMFRDAAAVLNLRNSTTAQTLRVSGTHTDSSNYVRLALAATSTATTITAETAGTGADNVNLTLSAAGTGQVVFGSPIRTTTSKVAGLVAAATVGAGGRSFVTDALTPVFGATVTGGGAVGVPVYSDGTNWYVG